MALSWDYFISQSSVAVMPAVILLVLVLLARSALQAASLDVTLLSEAWRLIAAYIVVRIGVLLFAASLGNKSWIQSWETRATMLIWLIIAAEHLGWLDPIIATLDSVGIAAGKSRITVWSVLKLLFILTLFMLVATWVSRWIERRLKKMNGVALSTRIGIAKFANAFLIALSILLGLNAAGVDLTALTVLTGAIGLGLGFGLQAIAANFVSGFVLLMDRSIKPGDVISLSGQAGTSTENFGWVQELRGRYVVVRDRDGVEMLVPNQQLISNAVINWSYTDPRIRLKLPIRISYHDDPELALQILISACEGQSRVLREPPPVSRLMHFSDSGIELELRFWISDPQEGVNNVRSEVNRAIWRLFKQHGITIPVAQREILVRNVSSQLD
jgi:small-conductance mechanosensitive channel